MSESEIIERQAKELNRLQKIIAEAQGVCWAALTLDGKCISELEQIETILNKTVTEAAQ